MKETLIRGSIGAGTPLMVAAAVPPANTVEAWLRVVSLVVGIATGCLMFWNLWRKRKEK